VRVAKSSVIGATVAAALVIACASRSPAPTVAPRADTSHAGRALSAWLGAYNTANVDSLRAFAAEHFAAASLATRSAEERAASDRWMHVNLGPMSPVSVKLVGDTVATAVVRQRLIDGWGRVTVRVETGPAPERRLVSRSITFFEPPPTRGSPRTLDAALARDADAYARRLASADIFAGVVLVAAHDSVLLARAYGAARREPMVLSSTDTRFQLASVSKMFTAVAIAKLIDEGRLSFTDTLSKLLPDYPNSAAASRITVEQLLAHTSGVPDYFMLPAYAERQGMLRELRDFWPVFANEPLRFAPGTSYEYSSSGYILLGSIIERVSGRPFREYVAEHVLGPAGMMSTSYEEGAAAAPLATPYTKAFGPGRQPDSDHWHEVPLPASRVAMSSGGGTSTARDLAKFMNALIHYRLISKRVTDYLLANRVQTEDGGRGLGFESNVWNGVRVIGHNGFARGVFNQVDAYPDLDAVVVVLSNTDTSGGGAVSYWLRLQLSGDARP